MMFLRKILVALVLLCPLAQARAEVVEQAMLEIALPPFMGTTFYVDQQKGDNRIMFLENFIDGNAPTDLYIVSASLWVDGVVPGATTGNFGIDVDPQGQHGQETGYPWLQKGEPKYTKYVLGRTVGIGQPNVVSREISPPIRYSKGDTIEIAPEIFGNPLVATFLLLGIQASPSLFGLPSTTKPDFNNLTMPQWPYKVEFDSPSTVTGAVGVSVRNLVPAPVAAYTEARCRLASHYNQFNPFGGWTLSNTQHVAICLQSAPGSPNCTAIPVELKFGKESGYPIYGRQQAWSDWTPFAGPAGTNLLAIADAFTPNVNVSAASWAGGVVTYTASASTAGVLATGQSITINGASPAGYNASGSATVNADHIHFSIPIAANPGAYVSGGLILNNYWSFKAATPNPTPGAWGSTSPSWDVAALPAPVTTSPGVSAIIDACQIR